MAEATSATGVVQGGAVVLDLTAVEGPAERERRREDLLRALEAARARRRRRARAL